ncbi:fluoride efflux transporter family protein [Corynebacterium lizhenjunii]|uniref:Fluoride-specific ion channel FluC n=1 Tax=Corynebacterium lizhenjunii TaxID=2709394 RepID=A0A7T0PAY8_9CORY|nr:fluoride efflux transporter family protein [Corynebacterium lizhenjunii]QPK78855.1 fluoride efflux transporter family protein [Corynebacterium lizhenjunii]
MREAMIVGLGAALGALARWGLGQVLGDAPWVLLAINVAGSGLMGLVRPGLFWGTGVLGGFTSLSAFAVLSAHLAPGVAAAYVAATLSGCVGAYLLGDVWRERRDA